MLVDEAEAMLWPVKQELSQRCVMNGILHPDHWLMGLGN